VALKLTLICHGQVLGSVVLPVAGPDAELQIDGDKLARLLASILDKQAWLRRPRAFEED
jgi:hypothetical protein